MIPTSFDDIRRFCDDSLTRRERASGNDTIHPSEMWKMGTHTFRYVRHLPDWELKRIRRHTYHVTGDTYLRYHYFSERERMVFLEDYLFLRERLQFAPTEGECGIGFDFGGVSAVDDMAQMQGAPPESGLPGPVRVSRDLIRYMRVCDDLVVSGAIHRPIGGNLLEIGGGYGGLASVIHQFDPTVTYVIVDLEETQFLQAMYLANRFGLSSLRLCLNGLDSKPLDSGCFYLVPQHVAESVQEQSFVASVNQQSMQEMTVDQVSRYCGIIGKCASRFYSCNLDQHPHRFSTAMGLVADLSAVFLRSFGPPSWRPAPRRKSLLGLLGRRKRRRDGRIGDSRLPRAVYDVPR